MKNIQKHGSIDESEKSPVVWSEEDEDEIADEDEITAKVYLDKGIVYIEFGKNVEWIGMPQQQALTMATKLIINARKANKDGDSLTLKLGDFKIHINAPEELPVELPKEIPGKFTDEDKGIITAKFFFDKGTVGIEFGKEVEWIGMLPQQALDMASNLIINARKETINDEPLTFRLGEYKIEV